jgi:ubiquinol-cytochrome c reductase cytochrome c1 subunit
MNKISIVIILGLAVLFSTVSPTFAAGGGNLESAGINIRDVAATQRGAKWFVNYCLSCHSASFMRYQRLVEDLGLDEDLVRENLVFADAKLGETMDIAMRPADSEVWFGKTPPDLSLATRARGNDWLYTYMKSFYKDDSGKWNNLVLENASMPHVFWQLQGIQVPVWSTQDDEHAGAQVIDHLTLLSPGLQSPEEYEQTVRDLVTFLD